MLNVSLIFFKFGFLCFLFQLKSPQLLIKSRKAPAPEGFDVHKSYLETLQNSPFLVYWKSGKIEDVYLDTKEEISITNIKKGIASLFQVS